MPHSVRYKRAAAAEVEAAIGRYAQPEIDQASAFVFVSIQYGYKGGWQRGEEE